MQLVVVLLFLTISVSFYDYRYHEIPNWVTWPLLLVGIYAHAPGTLTTVASSVLLVLLWLFFSEKIGAGDVKLWLALLWALPLSAGDTGSMAIFLVISVTSGLQIVFRKWCREGIRLFGPTAAPAAWRTVVFMALITLLYWFQAHHV